MFKDMNWKETLKIALIAIVAVGAYDMLLRPTVNKFINKGDADAA